MNGIKPGSVIRETCSEMRRGNSPHFISTSSWLIKQFTKGKQQCRENRSLVEKDDDDAENK